jgi:DNA-binding NtrC family response regulator
LEISEYKVLFVDDSEDILKTIERMFFKEKPLKIFTAATTKLALEIITSMDLDLIVTDIKMPDMHGLELIEEIRKKYLDIPIIVYTAYTGMKEDFVVQLYNIEAYYIKPNDCNRLFKKIKEMSTSTKRNVK